MNLRQIDAIVECAQAYRDACARARFFATHGYLGESMCDKAGVAAIDAKHAYDAIVAQIHQIVVETYVDAD